MRWFHLSSALFLFPLMALTIGAKKMDPKSVTELTQWFQSELQRITTTTKDPAKMKSDTDALTADFENKLKSLQAAQSAEPKAETKAESVSAPISNKAAVKFISVYVEPYYSGPTEYGKPPLKVQVNAKLDEKLRSTSKEVILEIHKELLKGDDISTPMTFFVLASRLYDVGARPESVFWFYVAKDRLAAVREIGRPELVGGAVDACGAFYELIGPAINGYAFCNIDKQISILNDAAEWTKKNPYQALLNPNIHIAGIDPAKALAASAQKRANQVGEAKKYFSDAKNRQEFLDQRKANGMIEKYCW